MMVRGRKRRFAFFSKSLNDLDLESEDKDEVRSDANAALIQLESPKPKMGIIRSLLASVREKLITAVAGKASTYGVDKAQEAIQSIDLVQN